MKLFRQIRANLFIFGLPFLLAVFSCNNDDSYVTDLDNTNLTNEDSAALLFMLEEEKLARDTYTYLEDLWEINQFSNIKKSEQSHMDAVIGLLDQYNIAYTLLSYGEFNNPDIQTLYDQFIDYGSENRANALEVGANIEDLDIVDLANFIDATTNSAMIKVFESLQCGSRNHLRSIVTAIEVSGNTYEPQYLTLEDYTLMINDSQEQCGR
ncbi:hypothetical protein SAMN03080594_101593 [Arenibacter palladensis]|uniref:DUF2202 domain-containing protein n=1 Tax=Arenibacter palladensis TaxID=237373 RepID=A0A1M4UF35_9FLAO|nr:DUF2202 domain-containing protein [Arenibacter palladensis]SHE55183.1 hypothetical protein SAMN03080594_101593 [Arenibacter palladensis]